MVTPIIALIKQQTVVLDCGQCRMYVSPQKAKNFSYIGKSKAYGDNSKIQVSGHDDSIHGAEEMYAWSMGSMTMCPPHECNANNQPMMMVVAGSVR